MYNHNLYSPTVKLPNVMLEATLSGDVLQFYILFLSVILIIIYYDAIENYKKRIWKPDRE